MQNKVYCFFIAILYSSIIIKYPEKVRVCKNSTIVRFYIQNMQNNEIDKTSVSYWFDQMKKHMQQTEIYTSKDFLYKP